MPHMVNNISLESVAALYEQWRQNKQARSEKVPSKLKQLTATLCTRYKKSEICSKLNLNGTWFLENIASQASSLSQQNSEQCIEQPQSEFISVSLPQTSEAEQPCEIEVLCQHGKLAIKINQSKLDVALSSIVRGLR